MKKQSKTLVSHGTLRLSFKKELDEFLEWYEFNILHYSIDKHHYFKCKPFLSVVIYTDSVDCLKAFDKLIKKHRHS